jgi:hypothetical protein
VALRSLGGAATIPSRRGQSLGGSSWGAGNSWMKWWHLETLGETHGLGGFFLLELNGPIFLGDDTLVDLLLMFACLRKKLVLWIWMAYQFLNYLGLCNQKSGGCPDLRSNLSIRGRDWIMEVNSMSGVLRPQNEFEVACNVDRLGSLVETRSLCPPTGVSVQVGRARWTMVQETLCASKAVVPPCRHRFAEKLVQVPVLFCTAWPQTGAANNLGLK